MNEIPHIITERVDDMPRLLAQMQRMELPTLVTRWTELRVVVRSVRQAHVAEAALRARVAKAMAQIEALNQ
ncbi:MAG: hypothetical protein V3U27_04120 [Candidatus Tectomicrobia bacterium]